MKHDGKEMMEGGLPSKMTWKQAFAEGKEI